VACGFCPLQPSSSPAFEAAEYLELLPNPLIIAFLQGIGQIINHKTAITAQWKAKSY